MKYKYINKSKIIKISPRMMQAPSGIIYANESDKPKTVYKELVIEEKPSYNEETEELFSWFEDGEVITQKFKVIDKSSD